MPKLIHVVDDDSSFRTAIQRRLLKAGYEVEIYASAQDLLDRRPDERRTSCILLDIRIPDLRGPELQQRLKDLGSTLSIVFARDRRAETGATAALTTEVFLSP